MRSLFWALPALLLVVLAPALEELDGSARAQGVERRLTPSLLAQLRKGGFVIYFRHALTPNYKDPDTTSLENCATQRNLSEEGRAQAQAIGKAFRDLEIPLGIVRASVYCRCVDTARLAFGRVEPTAELILTGDDKADEASGQARHLRNMAKILPWPGTNTAFVGHGTGATILGGSFADEGEAVILRPTGAGFVLVAQLKANQWKAP